MCRKREQVKNGDGSSVVRKVNESASCEGKDASVAASFQGQSGGQQHHHHYHCS